MSILSNQLILKDYHAFLNYLDKKSQLNLTKTKMVLRSDDLMELNDLVHFKQPYVTNKNQQPAFSLINTFFHISTVSQLARIGQSKKQLVLYPNGERIQQFYDLNDDEQYFFLLEAFWSYINWEIAYNVRTFWDYNFYTKLIEYPPNELVSISENNIKRKGTLQSPTATFVAELFAAFGLLELVWDEKLDKSPSKYVFPYKLVSVTELGKVVIDLLFRKRAKFFWDALYPYDDDIRAGFAEETDDSNNLFEASEKIELTNPYRDSFSKVFSEVLPDLKVERSLFPFERLFVKGLYTFKIELGKKLYRTIALTSTHNLEDLHLAIQRLFDFDNDHLYAFYLNGKYDDHHTYNDSRGSGEGLFAEDVKIGQLGLYEGKTFSYVFDFGDYWLFSITLLSIDTDNTENIKHYKLLESVGKSPKQYYEEEE